MIRPCVICGTLVNAKGNGKCCSMDCGIIHGKRVAKMRTRNRKQVRNIFRMMATCTAIMEWGQK